MPTGRQYPYLGALANDGTGDPLRDALAIVARTTAELYDAAALQRAQTLVSRTTTARPVTPVLGDAYLVPTGASGDWAAVVGKLAVYEGDSGWVHLTAPDGHRAFVVDEGVEIVRVDGAFVDARAIDGAGRTTSSFAAAALAVLATVTPAAATIPYFNDAASATTTPISAAGRDWIAIENLPTMRSALGLGATSTVQFAAVLVGHPGEIAGAGTFDATIQAHGVANSGLMVSRWTADATAGGIQVVKSRGVSVGVRGLVADADVLGDLTFGGDDGVAFIAAAGIRGVVAGTPGLNDMPGALALLTTPDGAAALVERMRVDSVGRLLVGHTASIAVSSFAPVVQVHGTTQQGAAGGYHMWGGGGSGPIQRMLKSRGGVGAYTAVQAGDALGLYDFLGADGTSMVASARMYVSVDGAVSTGVVPSRFIFETTSAAGVFAERIRIDAAGLVSFGDPDTGIMGGTANTLLFHTSGAERVRVDASGRVQIGHTAAVSASNITPNLQVHGVGSSTGIGLWRWNSSPSNVPTLMIGKSASNTIGTQGLVSVGWTLASLNFYGDDGTKFVSGAGIGVIAEGTPAEDVMAARMAFYTNGGGTSLTERMRIDSVGFISFGDSDTGIQGGIANTLPLYTAGVERLRIDVNGRVQIGHSAAISNGGFSPGLQLHSTGQEGASVGQFAWIANATGPVLRLNKSRGGIGVYTATVVDDALGSYEWMGADGTTLIRAARIYVAVDGSVSTGVVPTRFVIETMTTAGVLTERLRITNTGAVHFPSVGTTASAANAFLDSGASPANQLLRSTSSRRYKTDVAALNDNDINVIDRLRPITYRSTAEADDPQRVHFGLIAEEVHEVDPRLVHFTRDGAGRLIPDGVQYDRLVVPLIAKIQRLEAEIAALKVA